MLESYLAQLSKNNKIDIVLNEVEKPISPTYVNLDPPFPEEFNPEHQLYIHQVEAIKHIRDGKNVVITTPTASGKSLSFAYPILEKILKNKDTTALFIYPTKALANDQLEKLLDKDFCTVKKYDGTLSQKEKNEIRNGNSNIILTNPDMIHASFLRFHYQWKTFFENLKFIVIDEAHVYRGYLGSQVGNVLQRLIDIANLYGSEPQVIASSATIKKPLDFLKTLTGKTFIEVSNNGAGSPKKHYLLVDPKGKDPAQFAVEQAKLLNENDIQTIIFCNTVNWVANLTELANAEFKNKTLVAGYHSKITTAERNSIEQGLKSKTIMTVIATNALEVGIDIGSLEACILFGMPKTGFEAWQRIGRVGRSHTNPALVMLVKYSNTLHVNAYDNYYFANPKKFIESKKDLEEPVVYPENKVIKKLHTACKKHEKAKRAADRSSFEVYKKISIRGKWSENYTIKDENRNAVGTIPRDEVNFFFYPGAIYQPDRTSKYGDPRIDDDRSEINVTRMDNVDHITRPIRDYIYDNENYKKRQVNIQYGDFTIKAGFSEAQIVQMVRSYAKIYMNTKKSSEIIALKKPRKRSMDGALFWMEFERDVFPVDAFRGMIARAAILDKGYCDVSDLHAGQQLTKIFLYEKYPENLKICETIYDNITELISIGAEKVRNCGCDNGCMSCIISKKYDIVNEGDKERLIEFLDKILVHEPVIKIIEKVSTKAPPKSVKKGQYKPGQMLTDRLRIIEVNDVEIIVEDTFTNTPDFIPIKD